MPETSTVTGWPMSSWAHASPATQARATVVFGPVVPCPEDVNSYGVVNVLDLIDVLLAFGQTCPPA